MNLLFLGGAPIIVPLIPLVGAIIFLYVAVKSHKGGSEKYVKDPDGLTGKWVKDGVKISYLKNGYFWFSMICLAATIGIVLWMYSDR